MKPGKGTMTTTTIEIGETTPSTPDTKVTGKMTAVTSHTQK